MEAKYIVIEAEGREMLFVFPALVSHNEMFETIKTLRKATPTHDWNRPYHRAVIVSAGFANNGVCYGCSISLDVASRPNIDTVLLQRGGM